MSFKRSAAHLLPLLALLVLLLAVPARAGHGDQPPVGKGIVLAAFGTSYPDALEAILHIRDRVAEANPDTEVRIAFTSSIIRSIWHKRQQDAAWLAATPGVPAEILSVQSPLGTMAAMSDRGVKEITVQSLHVFAGEEFADLKSTLEGLATIRTVKAKSRPFTQLRIGRPALGMPGSLHPYSEDIAAAVAALKPDLDQAKGMNAALVYMGHGNDFFSTGIYAEFQARMQQTYNHPVFVACVEGYPGFDDLVAGLKASGATRVLLKPFMIVAGDHASNDMAGDEADSWKTQLSKAGFDVTAELRGLGSLDPWAEIYVRHLAEALNEPGLMH